MHEQTYGDVDTSRLIHGGATLLQQQNHGPLGWALVSSCTEEHRGVEHRGAPHLTWARRQLPQPTPALQ